MTDATVGEESNWSSLVDFRFKVITQTVVPTLLGFTPGAVGGFFNVLTGHPIDLVKVRMQTAGSSINSTGTHPLATAPLQNSVVSQRAFSTTAARSSLRPFGRRTGATSGPSTLGMLKQILRNEGIAGLYRGVSAPLVAVVPAFALTFWSYEGAKRYQLRTYEQTELSINQIALAGAASGLPLACVLGPLERIKCLMQVNKTAGLDSFGHAVRYVYQQGGFPSLFRGTALTVCRDVPGNAAYFAGYECVRRMLGAPAEGSSAVAVTLFAGGMAGVMNWIVAIPVDVLKSRWQTSNQFHSVAHLLRDLLEKEGPGALCKGLRPALLRAFPANAACLLGVETANSFLALFQR